MELRNPAEYELNIQSEGNTLGSHFIVTKMKGSSFLSAVLILAETSLKLLNTMSQLCIFSGKNIVLVQLTTHRRQITEICLHQCICKNYLGRKGITIMNQKGLLTPGTTQILLFVSLMLCDFENEILTAHC